MCVKDITCKTRNRNFSQLLIRSILITEKTKRNRNYWTIEIVESFTERDNTVRKAAKIQKLVYIGSNKYCQYWKQNTDQSKNNRHRTLLSCYNYVHKIKYNKIYWKKKQYSHKYLILLASDTETVRKIGAL